MLSTYNLDEDRWGRKQRICCVTREVLEVAIVLEWNVGGVVSTFDGANAFSMGNFEVAIGFGFHRRQDVPCVYLET